jgi:DNA polymerase-3 subunit epsilon
MSQTAERYMALDHAIEVVQDAGFRVLRPFTAGPRVVRADIPADAGTTDAGEALFDEVFDDTLTLLDDALGASDPVMAADAVPNIPAPTRARRTMRGLIIDTETTGPDPKKDQIIQLGMVPITFDAESGEVLTIGAKTVMLEEPRVLISPEAIEVHGITADMVAGQYFDNDAVFAAVAEADVLLAHNAKFDRPLFDRRFPGYLTVSPRPWGCTYADIPWRKARYSSAALGALLIEHCGQFFDGHDAGEDCAATAECLATPFQTTALPGAAQWPLWHVLARIQHPAKRVFACSSPFDFKDRLQARGYRWNDPSKAGAAFPREPKAWYREVGADELDEELTWLTRHAYVHGDARLMAHVVDVSPLARYAAA